MLYIAIQTSFPPQTQYLIPTFIQLQFCVSSPHCCPSALHCIPTSCRLSGIYLQGMRPFGIFILHCVASAVIGILCSKDLHLSIFHTQILYCHLVHTAFAEPFPIVHTSGTQLIYWQEHLRYFSSISSIIVLSRFQHTAVFYSTHSGISMAFAGFMLSLRSSV